MLLLVNSIGTELPFSVDNIQIELLSSVDSNDIIRVFTVDTIGMTLLSSVDSKYKFSVFIVDSIAM